MVKVKLNTTNVQFYSEEIIINFPESPLVGDEISILNFIPYQTDEREQFLYEIEKNQLSFNGVITKRFWFSNNPKSEPILLIDVKLLQN
ncbi:hypothetical protein LPB90_18080 [Chryseobacterium sp. LC2016-29]|uniref:hypothetical protein n=1 Tax=Chryseobacterium sp. LC2016-29 TaxID=2897331 RepID=UPI001E2BB8E2|nr:hypothetical protein [Chryseobacterium sp. LC2016-29]MCD0480350.1 hypothetical protein [Chryseobacterium sp. LC2016-29]